MDLHVFFLLFYIFIYFTFLIYRQLILILFNFFCLSFFQIIFWEQRRTHYLQYINFVEEEHFCLLWLCHVFSCNFYVKLILFIIIIE